MSLTEVEKLHDYKPQIDSLIDSIKYLIDDRTEQQDNLTYMEIIGSLNRLIYLYNQELDGNK